MNKAIQLALGSKDDSPLILEVKREVPDCIWPYEDCKGLEGCDLH